MATRTTRIKQGSARPKGDVRSTIGGPASGTTAVGAAARKLQGTQALAAAFPVNAAKSAEFGGNASRPAAGQNQAPAEAGVTGSTLSERNGSVKLGAGKPL